MNYTDREILDLESTLCGVGLEEIGSFGIEKPENFNLAFSEKKFFQAVLDLFDQEILESKLEFSGKNWIRFKEGAKGSLLELFILKGPRVKAYKMAEKIGEIIGAEMIYEISE